MADAVAAMEVKVNAEEVKQKFEKIQGDLQTLITQIEGHLTASTGNVGILEKYTAASSFQGHMTLRLINRGGNTGHDLLERALQELKEAAGVLTKAGLTPEGISALLADPSDLLNELEDAELQIRLSLRAGKKALMLLEQINEQETNQEAHGFGEMICTGAKENMGKGADPIEKLEAMIDSLLVGNHKKVEKAHRELHHTANVALTASGCWESAYAKWGSLFPDEFGGFSANIMTGLTELNEAYLKVSAALGKEERNPEFRENIENGLALARKSFEASQKMYGLTKPFAEKTQKGQMKSDLDHVLLEVGEALKPGARSIKLLEEVLNSLQDKQQKVTKSSATSDAASATSTVSGTRAEKTAAPILPSGGPAAKKDDVPTVAPTVGTAEKPKAS